MANVFDMFLGKKEKGLDIFNIPEKKYCNDRKKLAKMEKKDILVQIQDMEKYISNICHKLDQGKREYEKTLNKLDQTTGKLNVLNEKMGMISNQHEELQVKFSNLQSSLQIMTKQKQQLYKTELQFIESRELSIVKVPDLAAVVKIYREQIMLMDKITYQNKQLKQKYSQLQTDFFSLSEKIAEPKPNNKKNNELDIFGEETEPDDVKNNQIKLVLETKQQMITLLNKKIYELQQRVVDLNERINDLNHEIEKKEAEIKQREQHAQRLYLQNTQNKQKITQLKEFQQELMAAEAQAKEQIRGKQLNIVKMNKQIKQLKQKLKLNQQQKKILIGNHNDKFVDSQFHEKQTQLLRTKYEHEIEAKNRQIASLRTNMQEIEKQRTKIQNSLTEYRAKQKQFLKTKDNLIEQTKKRTELQKKLQDEQENNQIKLKKLEFVANQQRIKAEALKRSLTNLESKQQEIRKQLDQLYEKKIVQDRKVAKMDMKLKSYKQMIQYLQKQKVQLERTFESKIKTMEEVVAHDTEEDENPQQQSEPSDRQIIEKDEALIAKLQSRIVDLEEEIYFLKEENRNLVDKKDELESSNLELQKNCRVISEKREQIVKQFKKMVSMQIPPKPAKQQQRNTHFPGRDKRIAEKALKGFDIFSKNLCAIYKQFLNLHMSDIQKKQVKELQGKINGLVGKCEDMKDVFQGYL